DDLALHPDIDALLSEEAGNRLSDIQILARDELRAELDHRDLAAEAPIHLCKFESDIAPAEHDQVRRQKIYIHHRAVGQIGYLIETRDRRHRGSGTHIDEDLFGPQYLVADRYLLRIDEPGVPLIDRATFQGF